MLVPLPLPEPLLVWLGSWLPPIGVKTDSVLPRTLAVGIETALAHATALHERFVLSDLSANLAWRDVHVRPVRCILLHFSKTCHAFSP